ncbi:hypothetical protein BCR41DRAFT_213642 [Lobosporangium transversale]|uniref:Uncharacterized protein n=1 Tax=Lobosporangium transversale TaxID=64571 RepID=A0A1Y2G9W0_9FUNG|nr:hypothetical protein BCR41DRAFT_213642 [Lobosporangium transversale]ORY99772.1 hypothetical protein BCR41DRAFT_213642 [Lobosporangium transversale]|eukprot:XP_021876006.1 hypothetical protein BCR41DRAFT_213642 [Lobosporangium transversale]
MSAAERRDSGILADSSESYSSAPSAGSLCPSKALKLIRASLPASLPSSLLASLPSSLPASRQATQSRSRKRKAQADTVVSYSGTSSSQVVTPHLQSEEQIQRLNVLRVKEFEAQVNTEEQRRHQLADSTKKTYIRYQQHWEAWCTRKGYGSDFSVRANKFLI